MSADEGDLEPIGRTIERELRWVQLRSQAYQLYRALCDFDQATGTVEQAPAAGTPMFPPPRLHT